MRRRQFQPLVWPVAVLIASGVTALMAEATARSAQTVTLYGLIKITSDLILLIGVVWAVIALVQIARRPGRKGVKPARPRA